MIVLGVHDGHDAGAALIKDGKILAAVNEERLNREKLYYGVPEQSILKVLEISKININDVNKVAIASKAGVVTNLGWDNVSKTKKLYQFISKYGFGVAGTKIFSKVHRNVFSLLRSNEAEKFIRKLGYKKEIKYIDHHLCHASSAYYTSGRDNCLVITSDGSGDGYSSTVYEGRDGVLHLKKAINSFHSIAYYYAYITLMAGFKMFKHEGKITGLAAHGNPDNYYNVFEDAFEYSDKLHSPINKLGLIGVDAIDYLKEKLKNCSVEDYSAAVQKRVEDVMSRFVEDYVSITGIIDVAVAGGIFANVKLNQRILELNNVNSLFIHPHMGDGGLAVGAALNVYANNNTLKPFILNDVYFGQEFSNGEIEEEIKSHNLIGKYVDNIERFIAEKLKEKKIVGHLNGRMEYGPRALGNRSILADPTEVKINDWLNKRLNRSEFMPFAPSILDTDADKYYKSYKKGIYPSKFMTLTFDTTKEADKAKAVVHVDNTTRPQVVTKEQNPRYYKILENYKELTGLPLFVNTSFNAHEESIICSPKDAINSFNHGTVDILVMGNWVLEK